MNIWFQIFEVWGEEINAEKIITVKYANYAQVAYLTVMIVSAFKNLLSYESIYRGRINKSVKIWLQSGRSGVRLPRPDQYSGS